MSKLLDITTAAVREAAGTQSFVKGILAINLATAATIKSTAAFVYSIGGIILNKAILAAQALVALPAAQFLVTGLSGFFIQPISTIVYYVVCLDALGNVFTVQGTFAGQQLTLNGMPNFVVQNGDVPDVDKTTLCPIGLIKIATNASTTFTVGTTALDAAGLVVTYFDLAGQLPTNRQP